MKKHLVIFVAISTFLAFVLLPFPLFLGSSTKVHLSFDDVEYCFSDLVINKDNYNSLFDNVFISGLKKLHDKYGCKFTLYTYADGSNGYRIENMPIKYKKDFEESSDWLKIGFHSSNPSVSKDSIANMTSFVRDFNRVTSEVKRFASENSVSNILRLHYFYATEKEVEFLAWGG